MLAVKTIKRVSNNIYKYTKTNLTRADSNNESRDHHNIFDVVFEKRQKRIYHISRNERRYCDNKSSSAKICHENNFQDKRNNKKFSYRLDPALLANHPSKGAAII